MSFRGTLTAQSVNRTGANDTDVPLVIEDNCIYNISFYNIPYYIKNRPMAMKNVNFSQCEYTNCRVVYDGKNTSNINAVIFDGRFVGKQVPFRPRDQIWIFAAHESPAHLELSGVWHRPPWKNSFNWTMTYDQSTSDIYLPYGEIRTREKASYGKRNFTKIALNKKDGALIVMSNCNPHSKRGEYINALKQYFPITVLGHCGKKWSCGKQYIHDNCFAILNTTYTFFLAFENSLCREYFTEKLFENYNNDILIVTRGGYKNESVLKFPAGSVISTNKFKSVKELGEYMSAIAKDPVMLAKMLQEKSKFYGVGYEKTLPRAMCDLCKMMNNQKKYHREIKDIGERMYQKAPCRKPDDVPVIPRNKSQPLDNKHPNNTRANGSNGSHHAKKTNVDVHITPIP